MTYRIAKSLLKLRAKFDHLYPGRDKSSDGDIGDTSHQARKSDHNEDENGVVKAIDVSHDPASGVDTYAIADYMRQHLDKRVRYIISNRRITGSPAYVAANGGKVGEWSHYDGQNPHDHHVHISADHNPSVYDDESEWDIGLVLPAQEGATVRKHALAQLGSSGEDVSRIQYLLGLDNTGVFDHTLDGAVRSFQRSKGIVDDGKVGPHTWEFFDQMSSPVGSDKQPSKPVSQGSLVDRAVQLAAKSSLMNYSWADRGMAPAGYIKGMAAVYALVLQRRLSLDPITLDMTQPEPASDRDVFSWYHSLIQEDGTQVGRLRNLFAILIGLGMRESSGHYCEGRDRSASNVAADTAEAGLFQMSWDIRSASPNIKKLFDEYSDPGKDGLLSIFKEGVTAKAHDLDNYGSGDGRKYQELAKSKPAFAVEAAAVGLRHMRSHWGPINTRKVEVRPEAFALLKQIEGLLI